MSLPVTPGVTYRPVVGHEGYAVGDDGSVWTCRERAGPGFGRNRIVTTERWRQVRTYVNAQGQPLVKLSPSRLIVYVHKLVLVAFVGPRPSGMQACHGDGNPANNRLENLRWDTPKANMADRERHGKTVRGVRHSRARLNDEAVRTIRQLRANGTRPKDIAKTLGITASLVCEVLVGKTWRHVV